MKKKILSCFLAMVMILALFPLSVAAGAKTPITDLTFSCNDYTGLTEFSDPDVGDAYIFYGYIIYFAFFDGNEMVYMCYGEDADTLEWYTVADGDIDEELQETPDISGLESSMILCFHVDKDYRDDYCFDMENLTVTMNGEVIPEAEPYSNEIVDATHGLNFCWFDCGGGDVFCTVPMTKRVEDKTATSSLTVVVPDADYTFHIPANMEIPFAETGMLTMTNLVYVTDTAGMSGKKVTCTVSATNLIKDTDEIGLTYFYCLAGASITQVTEMTKKFDCGEGVANGTAMYVQVADWSDAKPGEYKATMTFVFKVERQQPW